MKLRKKMIEVALPLEAINKAAAREKSIRHGHPSTLHLWWARRPLAAARAVIFAQMVDDPSAWPDLFPTEKKQEKERRRLFKIIEDLVLWENTTNERVLEAARNEVWASWRRTCSDNADHPRAKELFDRSKLPAFHDPFAGGGALPLEAQRLGLESYASDLNPVAVLINKAMIEIPPKFAGLPPVNPQWQGLSPAEKELRQWKGAQGLAEDVRHYGKWMHDEAERCIGHLYPKVEVTAEIVRERADLKPYVGKNLTVIAWLWARTVKSPNPAFADVDVPLVATFMLSTKKGKEAYIDPVIEGDRYRFTVKLGKPNSDTTQKGTKISGANFQCVMSGSPISGDYIKGEGRAQRMSTRLMAIVADGENGRMFLPPSAVQQDVAKDARPDWKPEVEFFQQALGFRVGNYGMTKWSDLFTDRQLVALTTYCDLVDKAMHLVLKDAVASGLQSDGVAYRDGGLGANAYAEAVTTYLGLTSSKAARFTTTLATWRPDETKLSRAFARNDVPITWDFAETNPFSGTGGDFLGLAEGTASVLENVPARPQGAANQQNAAAGPMDDLRVVSTDPPYFDNVGYADLSDYFYVWLRRSLRDVFPSLFATVTVPKADELVATPARHGGSTEAEAFFLAGMAKAMHGLALWSHPAVPVTIYYAFKQSESNGDQGVVNTGWETFLDAVIRAGFSVSGTWPVRTEGKTRMRGMSSNALASSIVLVCRKRPDNASTATRREFVQALEAELAPALRNLQEGNIAPVDLAQAAIGPGMAVYTRYAKVLDAEGNALTVKQALALINEKLDTVLAEQEGDFDADTRWALAWFEQVGFSDGEYGLAETLSKAKNTSVQGMVDAGAVKSGSGKVRLLRPEELPAGWNPAADAHLTEWEIVHQLIRALSSGGETGAAELVAKLGSRADTARELAYRLYVLCERKKRAPEALAYNALVQSWPEIQRLASESETRPAQPQQSSMFS